MNGISGALSALATPITTMPASAMAAPISCAVPGFSPNNVADIAIVKNTCTCTTIEASPAGMPQAMAVKIRPNITTPCITP